MLSRIELKNFLAFKEVDIRLGPLTVLTGKNSAGKSSVIRALAMLKQSDDAGELEAGKWMLNGELVRLGTGQDLLFAEPVSISGTEAKFASSIAVSEENELPFSWTAEAESDADVLSIVPSSLPRNGGVFSLAKNFQYLSADRAAPETTYPKSHKEVALERSLGPRGEHTANFLRLFGGEPVLNPKVILPGVVGSSLMEQTRAWLDKLSAGSSVEVSDVAGTELVTLRYPRLGQIWTRPHRATNVGHGMTVALPVIVAALAARKDSLLIVENPEIHLHPGGQALLGTLLAAAVAGGAQVILETHSDHVLNSLRLAVRKQQLVHSDLVINFFHRPFNGLAPEVLEVLVDARGGLSEWPEGFFDQFDNDLAELIS